MILMHSQLSFSSFGNLLSKGRPPAATGFHKAMQMSKSAQKRVALIGMLKQGSLAGSPPIETGRHF